jgi:TolA-binding protein
MSIESCETMRLVEAKFDGRLGEREAASLDRHVATCSACRAHAEDLPRLRAIAAEHAEPSTPLQQQRSRARLLSEAARIEPRRAAPARPTWATGLLLAAAMLVAAFAGWSLRAPLTAQTAAAPQGPHGPPSEPATTSIVLAPATPMQQQPARLATTVAPERGARFAQQSAGGAETVTLDEGAATFAVRPLSAGGRFIIKTADGEVELRGAVARVEAAGSKVRAVSVQEGKAEVRYGGAVFELSAGSAWSPPLPAPPPAVDPSPNAPAPAPIAAPRLGRASIQAAGSTPAARLASKPVTPTAAEAHTSEPVAPAAAPPEPPKVDPGATDFADAVHLFERGDYHSAARRLADFSNAHPDDGRAEDSAFLSILALQRTGKTAEAAAAAQRYLQAYPNGYRRAEAVKIAAKH